MTNIPQNYNDQPFQSISKEYNSKDHHVKINPNGKIVKVKTNNPRIFVHKNVSNLPFETTVQNIYTDIIQTIGQYDSKGLEAGSYLCKIEGHTFQVYKKHDGLLGRIKDALFGPKKQFERLIITDGLHKNIRRGDGEEISGYFKNGEFIRDASIGINKNLLDGIESTRSEGKLENNTLRSGTKRQGLLARDRKIIAGTLYEGNFNEKGKITKGKIIKGTFDDDEKIRTGQFYDGKFNKEGKLLFGTQKNGFFENGILRSGIQSEGIFKGDSIISEGYFKEGKFDEKGRLTKGTSSHGEFDKEGKLIIGTLCKGTFDEEGNLVNGTLCDGKFDEKGKLIIGTLCEGTFDKKGNLVNGTQTHQEFKEIGDLIEGNKVIISLKNSIMSKETDVTKTFNQNNEIQDWKICEKTFNEEGDFIGISTQQIMKDGKRVDSKKNEMTTDD